MCAFPSRRQCGGRTRATRPLVHRRSHSQGGHCPAQQGPLQEFGTHPCPPTSCVVTSMPDEEARRHRASQTRRAEVWRTLCDHERHPARDPQTKTAQAAAAPRAAPTRASTGACPLSHASTSRPDTEIEDDTDVEMETSRTQDQDADVNVQPPHHPSHIHDGLLALSPTRYPQQEHVRSVLAWPEPPVLSTSILMLTSSTRTRRTTACLMGSWHSIKTSTTTWRWAPRLARPA
ncbi:hypothetical protein DFH11DRAFT_1224638 [Phellopilus nigrolimitatus]|nr:hypothetical protein DFH11DRAFT_1224638 [Phellopilus nigrolimitatus]